jgi:hypothetical protein
MFLFILSIILSYINADLNPDLNYIKIIVLWTLECSDFNKYRGTSFRYFRPPLLYIPRICVEVLVLVCLNHSARSTLHPQAANSVSKLSIVGMVVDSPESLFAGVWSRFARDHEY